MILEQMQLKQSLISCGTACIAEALQATPPSGYSSFFVMSQEAIWNHYGKRVCEALAPWVSVPRLRLIPDGEKSKNLALYSSLLEWLAEERADRKSAILVVGGGVVGDLCGFVAASYMRGIDWLYIPTTLLAQQDASIGGKVAVNLPAGKNLVGAFWEPRAVIIDSQVLDTLPERQLNAGYMEFLKHGMLRGQSLFQAAVSLPVNRCDWAACMPLLIEGLKVKIEIVREDPMERGKRRLLNLGHTLGHAIESYTGYSQLMHGEAVGIGLIFAALLAQELGGTCDWIGLAAAVRSRLPHLEVSAWDRDRILDLTQRDKKGIKGVISWVLPYEPGRVGVVDGIERPVLERTFERMRETLVGAL